MHDNRCFLISTLMRCSHFWMFLLLVGTASGQNTTLISLDQAVDLALAHNHSILATRTMILQNQAQEMRRTCAPIPLSRRTHNSFQFSAPRIFPATT
jgi:hypothetical protein